MPEGVGYGGKDMPAGQPKKRGRPKKAGTGKSDTVNKKQPAKQVKAGGTWMAHVKKTFEAGKKKNPAYSYKTAMSDAKKTYKKKGA